jgi:hypothetical protein
MDLTLREGYAIQFCVKLIAVISHDNYYSFIALFVNLYYNRHLSLIRQFFFQMHLMILWITGTTVSPPAWISSVAIWFDLYFFYFAITISILKWLAPSTSGWVVHISICLTWLALCTFNNWEKYSSTYLKCCGNLQSSNLARAHEENVW